MTTATSKPTTRIKRCTLSILPSLVMNSLVNNKAITLRYTRLTLLHPSTFCSHRVPISPLLDFVQNSARAICIH